jgi:heat shock protein HtpX
VLLGVKAWYNNRVRGSRGSGVSRDLSLTLRMVAVGVLTPLVAVGLFVVVVLLMPTRLLWWLVFALVIGVCAQAMAYGRARHETGKVLTPDDDPELFALLDRLCALADISRPVVVLSHQRQANSWVVHTPRRVPRLYLTAGLRELLTMDELSAVMGHELAHIANRDALVMSVVGTPSRIMMCARGGGIDGALVMVIGGLSQIGTSMLSRYRELAADAGSAAITGHPSALASALLKVSDSVQQVPKKDLRAAAALNSFNLVAVTPRRHGPELPGTALLNRPWRTHPPLQVRIDALAAIERDQQSRRV